MEKISGLKSILLGIEISNKYNVYHNKNTMKLELENIVIGIL
jgi:hypothetical protein